MRKNHRQQHEQYNKHAARSVAAAVMAALVCSSAPARAQTYTWDGGGAPSQDWSTDANWTGSAPPSDTSTELIFQGAVNTGSAGTPLNQDIGNPMDVDSLEFGDGGFYLGGQALRVTPASAATGFYFGVNGGTAHILNDIQLGADARISHERSNPATFEFEGDIDLNGHVLNTHWEYLGGGQQLTVDYKGQISGAGRVSFTGSHRYQHVYFRQSNTFTGGFMINGPGHIRGHAYLDADNALGTGRADLYTTEQNNIQFHALQPVRLANGFLFHDVTFGDVGGVLFSGDITIAGNSQISNRGWHQEPFYVYTVSGADSVLTFEGPITDALGWDPGDPPNTFELSGGEGTFVIANAANTYEGATRVGDPAGTAPLTVIVDGDITSSSTVTVNPAATLRGTGTVPAVTVKEGGILYPDRSAGTLNVDGMVTLEGAGSVFRVDVEGGGVSVALAIDNGYLDLSSGGVLSLTGTVATASSFTLATFDEQAGSYGTFSTVLLNDTEYDWLKNNVNYGPNSITLFTGGTIILIQ